MNDEDLYRSELLPKCRALTNAAREATRKNIEAREAIERSIREFRQRVRMSGSFNRRFAALGDHWPDAMAGGNFTAETRETPRVEWVDLGSHRSAMSGRAAKAKRHYPASEASLQGRSKAAERPFSLEGP